MKPRVLSYSYQELAEQCMFASKAKIDIKSYETMDTHGLNRYYHYLQSLLTALGNISKILWHIINKGDEQGNETGENCEKELGVALNVRYTSPFSALPLMGIFKPFKNRIKKSPLGSIRSERPTRASALAFEKESDCSVFG